MLLLLEQNSPQHKLNSLTRPGSRKFTAAKKYDEGVKVTTDASPKAHVGMPLFGRNPKHHLVEFAAPQHLFFAATCVRTKY